MHIYFRRYICSKLTHTNTISISQLAHSKTHFHDQCNVMKEKKSIHYSDSYGSVKNTREDIRNKHTYN